MPFQRLLPSHEDLVMLRDKEKLSNREIAERYGVTAKSVSRAITRGPKNANGEYINSPPLPRGERLTDWVKKDLIYGEIIDFMRGYGKNIDETTRALQLPYPVVMNVLSPTCKKIRRQTAHQIVNAVMRYERRHGDPPDLYSEYPENR